MKIAKGVRGRLGASPPTLPVDVVAGGEDLPAATRRRHRRDNPKGSRDDLPANRAVRAGAPLERDQGPKLPRAGAKGVNSRAEKVEKEASALPSEGGAAQLGQIIEEDDLRARANDRKMPAGTKDPKNGPEPTKRVR